MPFDPVSPETSGKATCEDNPDTEATRARKAALLQSFPPAQKGADLTPVPPGVEIKRVPAGKCALKPPPLPRCMGPQLRRDGSLTVPTFRQPRIRTPYAGRGDNKPVAMHDGPGRPRHDAANRTSTGAKSRSRRAVLDNLERDIASAVQHRRDAGSGYEWADPRAGTVLGRLHLAGLLSDREFDAGCQLAIDADRVERASPARAFPSRAGFARQTVTEGAGNDAGHYSDSGRRVGARIEPSTDDDSGPDETAQLDDRAPRAWLDGPADANADQASRRLAKAESEVTRAAGRGAWRLLEALATERGLVPVTDGGDHDLALLRHALSIAAEHVYAAPVIGPERQFR